MASPAIKLELILLLWAISMRESVKKELTKMRLLAGAWTADQETNSNGEKLLELHSNDEIVTGEEEKGTFIEY